MAVSEQRVLPAEFIEAGGKTFLDMLSKAVGKYGSADLSKIFGPQFVAGQDPLQLQAQQLATQGIGAYKPFLQAAQASTGPGAYKQFMSPYQQDVIDTTLAEYDTQAAQGIQSIADMAAKSGNLGGGREGVMRSQYQNKSDLNRALLQSGLLQQGFTQANQLANQAFGQQQALAQQVPQLYGADIGTLRSAGAGQQAQAQAGLDATREANRLEAYEPYERLGYQGQGIASIASGAPGQYQSSVVPNPTPLQTALGVGSTLSGIYGNIMGPYRNRTN